MTPTRGAEGLNIIAQFWLDAGADKMQAFADQWGYWTGYPSSGFNNAKRGMIMNGNWMPGAMPERR